MTPFPKVVALAAVVGAAITDAALLVWAAIQEAPLPPGNAIGGGLTGGIVVGAVAWATYKSKVDAHAREIEHLREHKADREQLAPIAEMIRELRDDVKWLTRDRRGE